MRILIGAWILLAFLCVFMITLGYDEAWALTGVRSCLEPVVAEFSISPVSSSGGLFAFVNAGLEVVTGSRVWVHRVFSLICLIMIIGLLANPGGRLRRPSTADLLAVAPLLGITGTAEVGTTALGTARPVCSCSLVSRHGAPRHLKQ